MRSLWCTKNTYAIFKEGKEVGWIRFIKWESRSGWYIDEVSEGLPISKADHDASAAKTKLTSLGYTWLPGTNKPFYLYS